MIAALPALYPFLKKGSDGKRIIRHFKFFGYQNRSACHAPAILHKAVLCAFAVVLSVGSIQAAAETRDLFMVVDKPQVSATSLTPFDTVIVREGTEIRGQRTAGAPARLLVRIHPDWVRADSQEADEMARRGIASLARPGAEHALMDTTAEGWPEYVADIIAGPLLKKGFDGWVLDGIKEVGKQQTGGALMLNSSQVTAWRKLVYLLKKRFPDHPVWLANPPLSDGDEEWRVDAVLLEGALENAQAGGAVSNSDDPAIRVNRLRSGGRVPVYMAEFVDGTALDQADQLAARIRSLGARPLVSTKERDGWMLAPVREHSRRVLVLHGWDPKETEKPSFWPVDTMTAELFQTPLEWLGFEADYLDIGIKTLPVSPAPRYAAVIVDAEIEVPSNKELEVAGWLARCKDSGVPVLFAGGLPFSDDDALRVIGDAFGLRGTLQPATRVSQPEAVVCDRDFIQGETPMAPRVTDFKDLRAPDQAHVLVGLRGRAEDGSMVSFDPVFLASWGGMWLEPYVILRASEDNYLFYVDPYRMLTALLSKGGSIPSPDTTTRDGRRLFYSHIDGDGFAGMTSFRNHPLCAELVRDRLLKVFPFPITVSVVEADMQAVAEGLEDKDAGRIQDMARSIFALPNVQVASHSYSHPYQWDPGDPNPGIYDTPNMPLKARAGYDRIDYEREIRGSVDYINKNLAPKDKRVELMLWSGNCRPGVGALRVCEELGIDNMNGGNTIISRLYPGIAGIAPRVMPWGDSLQIHAANQNEFMYANGWNGPFYGGFADVIDTFERTEAPRRVKPVNVYYHFYSAMCLSSLRALEKIHQWCLSQPLHSVTALQFAQMTRDAWGTRVFDVGPRRWLLANQGRLRTFRLPLHLGRPDMANCSGVTGYTEFQDSVYVHTNGRPVVELVLRDGDHGPPTPENAHLFLASSSAEIEFELLDPWKADFTVTDLRPVQTDFGGLPAGVACEVTVNGAASRRTTDDRGFLSLSLPASAQVTIDATRSRYASAR